MADSWTKTVLIAAATGITGFAAASVLTAGAAPASDSPAVPGEVTHVVERTAGLRPVVVTRTGSASGLSDADLDDVRQVVRDELQGLASDEAEDPEPPTVDEVVDALDDEQTRVFDEARALVTTQLARGRWSVEDRDALRGRLARLPEELHRAVVDPVIVAINRDELRVDFVGAPL